MGKQRKMKKDVPYIKIGYIGGGSRGWAPQLFKDLAASDELTGEVRLYDIDKPQAQLNARWSKKVNESKYAKSQWKATVVDNLKQCLSGVDFVVASIQPGPIEMMGADINLPAKYGILHPVGDTVGPAGVIRGLRSAIDYAEMAEAIARYCPEAWVINYTNPMTICTRTLYKVFPEAKAFGCCHEMFGTQDWLARLLGKYHGIKGLTRYDLDVTALGINHFTWITKAQYKGINLIDLYRKEWQGPGKVRKIPKEESDKMGMFECKGQVQYDLFRRFGILPTGGERHITEFVPWYLKDLETIESWGVKLTPFDFRYERYMELPKKHLERIRDPKDMEIEMSGEETIAQIKALLGLGDLRTNVNLPNIGQIDGLPQDAVVETFAYFRSNSVKPEYSGSLPPGVETLILRHIYNQEMTIEAALTRDKNLAFQAFLNDPLMTLTTYKAEKLFNEMLKATKACLPGFKI